MKKILLLLPLIALLSSCVTYKTYSSGKDDVSYVMVLSENDKYKDVSVKIDNKLTVLEEVFHKSKTLKSPVIKLTPGQHTVEITHKDKVLYSEKVYIGLQETKKILLP